jgi:hypothetical protein
VAEFAYEPEPELKLTPGESFREISGRSPWAIAGRRLVRNRLAIAYDAPVLTLVAARSRHARASAT